MPGAPDEFGLGFALNSVALIALVAAGCGRAHEGTGMGIPSAPPAVAAVVVSGWGAPLAVGQSVQVAATAVAPGGSTRSVTRHAEWRSDSATVAIVSPAGLVTAIAPGSAGISAVYGGHRGALRVQVASGGGPAPSGFPTLACGGDRWHVRSLADAQAVDVRLDTVVRTTVRALNDLPRRCPDLPPEGRLPEERQVFEVDGRVVDLRLEHDRTYTIVLEDPSDGRYAIAAEIADLACVGAERLPFRARLESVRHALLLLTDGDVSRLDDVMVRVRGAGFYSSGSSHRHAASCLSLAPVTAISRVRH